MKLRSLYIRNFKAIREMYLEDIENALILVGQNNTGKTTILEAIRAVLGDYRTAPEDFDGDSANMEMEAVLELTETDIRYLHQNGRVSSYKRLEPWYQDFCKKLPSFTPETGKMGGCLSYSFTAHRDGWVRFSDGRNKNNLRLTEVFPRFTTSTQSGICTSCRRIC